MQRYAGTLAIEMREGLNPVNLEDILEEAAQRADFKANVG